VAGPTLESDQDWDRAALFFNRDRSLMGCERLAFRWLAGLGLWGLLGACELMDQAVVPLLSGEQAVFTDPTAVPVGTTTASPDSVGGAAQVGQWPPLALIRFDHSQAAYERPLRSAVDGALARQPEVVFDLVAVEPVAAGSGQADPPGPTLSDPALRRDLAEVFQALVQAGVPAERIFLSATTQPTIQVREVHVYAR
jgi:hypothetical protein